MAEKEPRSGALAKHLSGDIQSYEVRRHPPLRVPWLILVLSSVLCSGVRATETRARRSSTQVQRGVPRARICRRSQVDSPRDSGSERIVRSRFRWDLARRSLGGLLEVLQPLRPSGNVEHVRVVQRLIGDRHALAGRRPFRTSAGDLGPRPQRPERLLRGDPCTLPVRPAALPEAVYIAPPPTRWARARRSSPRRAPMCSGVQPRPRQDPKA